MSRKSRPRAQSLGSYWRTHTIHTDVDVSSILHTHVQAGITCAIGTPLLSFSLSLSQNLSENIVFALRTEWVTSRVCVRVRACITLAYPIAQLLPLPPSLQTRVPPPLILCSSFPLYGMGGVWVRGWCAFVRCTETITLPLANHIV